MGEHVQQPRHLAFPFQRADAGSVGARAGAADKAHSIPEGDRVAYTAAYSRPGRMHAGWAYFVSFPQAATDFAQLSQVKLTMPVLAIGGEKANGELLTQQVKLVATDVTVVVLKNCGHWVLEEQPRETIEAPVKFL